jgi:hypothetical protein
MLLQMLKVHYEKQKEMVPLVGASEGKKLVG